MNKIYIFNILSKYSICRDVVFKSGALNTSLYKTITDCVLYYSVTLFVIIEYKIISLQCDNQKLKIKVFKSEF